MRIAPWRRLTSDDLGTTYPGGMTGAIGPINIQIEALTNANINNLTFADNMTAEVKQISIIHNTPTPITMSKISNPIFVIPGATNGVVVTGCTITAYQSSNVPILTVLFNGAPTTAINMSVIFFTG